MKKIQIIFLSFFLFFSSAYSSDRTIGDILKGVSQKNKIEKLKKRKIQLEEIEDDQDVQPLNLSDIKPPKISAKSSVRWSDDKSEKLIDEEIEQLYKIVTKSKNKKYRGEFWLRLADAYLQKSTFVEDRLNDIYNKRLRAYQAKKSKKRPRLNLRPVHDYYRKATKLYFLYTQNFPKGDKTSYATFFLGFIHMSWGREGEGLKYYKELIAKHPKSSYKYQALQGIGEYFFDKDKFASAKTYYRKVVRNSKSKFYTSSLYKLAWCEYRLGNVNQAINYMVKVYKISIKDPKNYHTLESRKDLITFYTDSSNYKGARAFFAKFFNDKLLNSVMEAVAYRYSIAGKTNQAIYHLKDLIRRNPDSLKSYKYQREIVKIYSSQGGGARFQKQLYTTARKYGPKSKWISSQSNKKEVIKISNAIEKSLRINALKLNKNFENSGKQNFGKQAALAYKNYFYYYKEAPESFKLRFYYAELLFSLKQYKPALSQYRVVILKAPQSKFYADSLFNSLLALEHILPPISEAKKNKENKMTLWHEAFIEIGELYLRSHPKNIEIKKRLALVAYYYGNKKKSLEYLNDILSKSSPNAAIFKNSFNLVVSHYNETENYQGLVRFLDSLVGRKSSLRKSQIFSDLRKIKKRAEFKFISQSKPSQGRDSLSQALKYETFFNEDPKSLLGRQALFNAALVYEKEKNLIKSYETYYKLSQIKPSNKQEREFVLNSYKFLASFYEKTAQFQKQLQAFLKLRKIDSNSKASLDYTYNIALLFEVLGSYKKSIKNYKSYYSKVKSLAKQQDLLYKIAEIYDKNKSYDKSILYYKKYIDFPYKKKPFVVNAAHRISEIYSLKNKKGLATVWNKRVLTLYRKHRTGSSFASEARIRILLGNEYKKFKSIKFSKKVSEKILNKKLNSYNELVKEFESVIKQDHPKTIVSSLYILGEISENVYDFIKNSPLPRGLNKKEKNDYRKAIALEAQPFYDKSIDFWENSLSKAFEFDVYGQWADKSYKKTKRFLLNKIPVREEKVFFVEPVYSLNLSQKTPEKQAFVQAILDKKYDKSLNLGIQILLESPNDSDILSGCAFIHFKKGHLSLAKHILNKIKNKSAIVLNNIAVVSFKEKELEESLEHFKKGLILTGKGKNLISLNLGQIYLQNKNYSGSFPLLKKGVAWLDKNLDFRIDLDKNIRSKTNNNLAVASVGAGDFKFAIETYEKLLKQPEVSVEMMVNYAMIMIEKNRYRDAERILSEIKLISSDQRVLKWVNKMKNRIKKEGT